MPDLDDMPDLVDCGDQMEEDRHDNSSDNNSNDSDNNINNNTATTTTAIATTTTVAATDAPQSPKKNVVPVVLSPQPGWVFKQAGQKKRRNSSSSRTSAHSTSASEFFHLSYDHNDNLWRWMWRPMHGQQAALKIATQQPQEKFQQQQQREQQQQPEKQEVPQQVQQEQQREQEPTQDTDQQAQNQVNDSHDRSNDNSNNNSSNSDNTNNNDGSNNSNNNNSKAYSNNIAKVWQANFTMKDKNSKVDSVLVEISTNLVTDKQIDWNSEDLACNRLPNNEYCHFPVSFMKSLLQKNVRLCRPQQAVRTALHLIRTDFEQFIRRLSIIMIEDAILHPALPFVMWLTVSCANGYHINENHVNTCLQIVHELAAVSVRDPLVDLENDVCTLPPTATATTTAAAATGPQSLASGHSTALVNPRKLEMSRNSETPTFAQLNQMKSEDEACLIKSILARAAFGGMTGDVAMLINFTKIWYDRFHHNKPPPPQISSPSSSSSSSSPSPSLDGANDNTWMSYLNRLYGHVHIPINYKHVGPLTFDDVALSAVDFHCSAIIDVLLAKDETRCVIEDYLRNVYGSRVDVQNKLQVLIWKFRSSVNNKQLVFPSSSSRNRKPEQLQQQQQQAQEQTEGVQAGESGGGEEEVDVDRDKLVGLWHMIKEDLDEFSRSFVVKRIYPKV